MGLASFADDIRRSLFGPEDAHQQWIGVIDDLRDAARQLGHALCGIGVRQQVVIMNADVAVVIQHELEETIESAKCRLFFLQKVVNETRLTEEIATPIIEPML